MPINLMDENEDLTVEELLRQKHRLVSISRAALEGKEKDIDEYLHCLRLAKWFSDRARAKLVEEQTDLRLTSDYPRID